MQRSQEMLLFEVLCWLSSQTWKQTSGNNNSDVDNFFFFYLARLRSCYKYKDFCIAMLSKAPYPSYNQFVQALQWHEQMLIYKEQEEQNKKKYANYEKRYVGHRGCSRHHGGRLTLESKVSI